jgi:hypothetical protein
VTVMFANCLPLLLKVRINRQRFSPFQRYMSPPY